ncbi:hypothetical protein SteCoe_430 [Stentor coeruleus]|uniref:Uncharacterized protein n=1 Tax=Stentor coeruleus TaxID=5963 RepID=A0A1R2D459_9CILI|nr:hypothetical protein SteCoe_430 [Stentor coeruleus]
MKLFRKFRLRTLAPYLFYLSLWDITTDFCYLASRPMISNFFWWLSVSTFMMNLFGPALILVFGQIFNTFLNTMIFKIEKFCFSQFISEIHNLIVLSHAFVFKTILDQNIPKQKAIYRTAFLIHITFESFPQLVLQSVTNQKFHIWTEPFAIVSLLSSITMIAMALFVAVKTDKYYL